MSSYSTTCHTCDHKYVVSHNGKPGALVLLSCPECSAVGYTRLPGAAKAIRQSTLDVRLEILHIFAEQEPPLTVRQVYYALTVRNAIPKTEQGYRQTCYQLKHMRLDGSIPYGWIADNTRWHITPQTYTGMMSALEMMHESYRRDLWARQADYVEIWVEKDALAGVIQPMTYRWNVPLAVVRGYSSMTFLYEAAEQIKAVGKPAYIYHFGDYDPSGVNAAESAHEGLLGHGAEIHFVRAAITEDQIALHNLPSRPTKRQDPRAKDWQGDSVELDALPAPILRELVEHCILNHVDGYEWYREKQIEALEKATLRRVLDNFEQAA